MDPLHTKAYAIFVAEVTKHLEKVSILFGRATSVTPAQLKDARISFHRIKGGAGFFGLQELGATAAQLETLVSCDHSIEGDKIKEIQSVIVNLRGFASKMPPVES